MRHLGVQEKETKLPTGRQLDYWPGGRVVSWGDGQRGTHRITRILGGQTIQENFNGRLALNLQGMSPAPVPGDLAAELGKFAGLLLAFQRAVTPIAIIFSTVGRFEARDIPLRTVFFLITSEALAWRRERSDDDGATWQLRWRIKYRRSDRPQ